MSVHELEVQWGKKNLFSFFEEPANGNVLGKLSSRLSE